MKPSCRRRCTRKSRSPALAATRFEPVTRTRPWDEDGPVRRAAVSAFGFGGINAHVVLEAGSTAEAASVPARTRQPRRRGLPPRRPGDPGEAIVRLAAGSAREMAALLAVPGARLLDRAGQEPGEGSCRLAIIAPDARRLELARKVAERGAPWRGRGDMWFTTAPMLTGPEQVAFLFPGLEPEWAPHAEGIAESLGLPAPRLHGTTASGSSGILEQALDVVATGRLFAAALGEIGITPGALAGHSLGEWTAMVVAGIFPDADDFIDSLRPGMVEFADAVYLTLGTGASQAAALTSGLDGVVITHDNCPRQTVACGPAGLIDAVAARAREAGILTQPLPFRTGFHSPMFAPASPRYGRRCRAWNRERRGSRSGRRPHSRCSRESRTPFGTWCCGIWWSRCGSGSSPGCCTTPASGRSSRQGRAAWPASLPTPSTAATTS